MAIRYSIVSNLSTQIVSEYLVTCDESKTRGHTDTLEEAYEAATVMARRAMSVKITKKVVVRIYGTDHEKAAELEEKWGPDSGVYFQRTAVATIRYEQMLDR
jgi:hypothetical protein